MNDTSEDVVVCSKVNFCYTTSDYKKHKVLHDVNFALPKGSRCLMIGSNGAGKSTLLRLLAGRHMLPDNPDGVLVLGKRAFYQTEQLSGITYLGGDWTRSVAFAGNGVPFQADIEVQYLRQDIQKEFSDRRDRLYEVLDIDPHWKMHEVSDGQRRRVQIMLGLLRPFKVLLLDEMTVDLDVLARARFLQYLRDECEDATILYATHIFDGMDNEKWPTHLLYIDDGRVLGMKTYEEVKSSTSSLYVHISEFLQEMLDKKKIRDEEERRLLKNTIATSKEVPVEKEKIIPFADRIDPGFAAGRMAAYRR